MTFLDLKKIIEYDRKHNNVSQLSTSMYKDWDQSYSQRIKNSTPNKNATDRNRTANRDEHEDEANPISKKKKPKIQYYSSIVYHNSYKCQI